MVKNKIRSKKDYVVLNSQIAQIIGGTFRIKHGIMQIVTKHKVIATKNLDYHKDWNSLMKVIKFLSKKTNEFDLRFKEIIWSLEYCDIKITYEEVVKYLKL